MTFIPSKKSRVKKYFQIKNFTNPPKNNTFHKMLSKNMKSCLD